MREVKRELRSFYTQIDNSPVLSADEEKYLNDLRQEERQLLADTTPDL